MLPHFLYKSLFLKDLDTMFDAAWLIPGILAQCFDHTGDEHIRTSSEDDDDKENASTSLKTRNVHAFLPFVSNHCNNFSRSSFSSCHLP